MDIWQEIDKLRSKIKDLQGQLARQNAILAQHPQIRVGQVISVDDTDGSDRKYALQEIGVDSEKEEAHIDVRLLPNDPGPSQSKQAISFLIDVEGYKFLLPIANRVILIQDLGSGEGRHIEKDIDGTITVPSGSETLNIIVSEPDKNFHDLTPALFKSRIYPGMKLTNADGTINFYLVFLSGCGDDNKNHDITLSDATTLRITTDFAGKFKDVSNF